jgi:hypothetical protein
MYYIQLPASNDFEKYHLKRNRLIGNLRLVIVLLCITLVVIQWDKIMLYARKLYAVTLKRVEEFRKESED